MPSTYAHYRMGQEVRRALAGNPKLAVESYPELYLIGLHGPDILFYYHALTTDPVNQIGYGMHDRPGREFFEKAAEIIRQYGGEKAYLSYVYGFICHFALDVTCHGYIDEKIEASGVTHAEIEVEFDRMLMVRDGLDPIRHKLTGHIVPSERNAKVIQAFFNGVTGEQVKKALEGMITYNNLLVAPSRLKREMIYLLLRASGNYKEMHGLLVNYRPNPDCEDSDDKLSRLYERAKKMALRLIGEYGAFILGHGALDPIYDYTFGSRPPEEIPEKKTEEAAAFAMGKS